MTPNKIERIEEATWEDPIFTFVIERHGRTVHGSSRAELQRWTVDLDAGTATTAASHSHRQLTPPRSTLYTAALAAEIARLTLVSMTWRPSVQ
jgi:hypothetical protein